MVAADRTLNYSIYRFAFAFAIGIIYTYQVKVVVVAAAAWPLANGCVPSTAPAVAVHLGCHARRKKRKEHE